MVDVLCTHCGRWKSEAEASQSKARTHCPPPHVRAHAFDGKHPFHVTYPRSLVDGWHPSQDQAE